MKKLFILTLALVLCYAVEPPTLAQEQPTQQPTTEEQEKEKAEREKNAYRLLDQLIDEAQSLRLTENRVRVQIQAATMSWDRNQGRARSLFQMAADGIVEMGRNIQPTTGNRRNEGANQERRAFQMRQELVLAAARHDAQLAYQLLASTKPPAQVVQTTNVDQRNPRPQVNPEDNLEQTLLGRIAALDPKLAAQNAEQLMEKGQFPRTMTEVINQLQKQDPEAATKLADRTVKRIQATNLLTSNEATVLAQSLLGGGIRPAANPTTANGTPAPASARPAVLEQSAYVDLLSAVIDAALKATPPNNPRTPTLQRGRTPGGTVTVARPAQGTAPTENQNEYNNARRLLAGLQQALPAIDQYLPARATAVRQKLSEMGISSSAPHQGPILFGDNTMTADSLMKAASTAPPQLQTRLYQQAAFRALEEGNTDRARQIATNNLPAAMRDSVVRYIDTREMAKGDASRFDELRQTIARLQTDNEKINLLVQLAGDTQKNNPKMAIQLLEEARQITNRRATSYDHFEQQFRVARAYSSIDPARSFEVLDAGISQLNELLAAAAVLNGFELNIFRDGEMSMQGGNGLTSTVQRVGQELAILALTDLERAETLAGRFQMTEPRIITKLAIVQELLSTRPPGQQRGPYLNPLRGVGQNFNIVRPE